MPKSKKATSKKDSKKSENGVQKPETSRQNQEDNKTSSKVHAPDCRACRVHWDQSVVDTPSKRPQKLYPATDGNRFRITQTSSKQTMLNPAEVKKEVLEEQERPKTPEENSQDQLMKAYVGGIDGVFANSNKFNRRILPDEKDVMTVVYFLTEFPSLRPLSLSLPTVSSTEDTETVNQLSKLSIAQKIAITQKFVVEEEDDLSPESSERKFVERMYNAFWDHVKEQLSKTPPDFSCTLELLINIKQILVSLLLPRQNRLRNEIEEALNINVLKEETERGSLDVPHLSSNIINLMALMCAPIRDEAVQELGALKDPVQLLRGIFQLLGLMKMDMVNYSIHNIRPYLQEQSIKNERAQFQELLDKQPDLLDCTTKWMTRAVTDLITSLRNTPSSFSGLGSSIPAPKPDPDPPSLTTVLYQGYLTLVLKDHGIEEFPETLLTDKARLQTMKSKLRHLTVLASVLLVARSFSCGVLFSSPDFVDKLKAITKGLIEEFNSKPEESMLNVSEQVSQEIHQGLQDTGLTALSTENRASLVCQLRNIAKKENCIRIIIEQRIHLFLKCCLIRGMQESLLDFPGGLLFIEPELAELGWKFVNLIHHNQLVFNPYYAEILKNIISPPNEEENDEKPV